MKSETISTKKFNRYLNEQFQFEFEYPVDWDFQIQKIPNNSQKYCFIIFIIAPVEKSKNTGYSLLSLWVSPSLKRENSLNAVNYYIDNIVNSLYKDTSKIIGSRLEQMADISGTEVEYANDIFRPIRVPKKYQTLVVEHTIRMVIEKNDNLFDLKFSANDIDFAAEGEVYHHAKKTFKFLN